MKSSIRLLCHYNALEKFSQALRIVVAVYGSSNRYEGGLQMNGSDLIRMILLLTYLETILRLALSKIIDRIDLNKAQNIAGLILTIGHFIICVDNSISFYTGYLLMGIGGIMLKSTSSNIINIYSIKSRHTDDEIFRFRYWISNVGSVLGGLVFGGLQISFGWHKAFVICAIIISIYYSLITIIAKKKISQEFYNLPKSTKKEIEVNLVFKPKERMLILIITTVLMIIYYSIMNSESTFLLVWTQSYINRAILGFNIPVAFFPLINPIIVVLFTDYIHGLYDRLRASDRDVMGKLVVGLLMLLISAIIILCMLRTSLISHKLSMSYILWIYIFLTLGEIVLTPAIDMANNRAFMSSSIAFFEAIQRLIVGLAETTLIQRFVNYPDMQIRHMQIFIIFIILFTIIMFFIYSRVRDTIVSIEDQLAQR